MHTYIKRVFSAGSRWVIGPGPVKVEFEGIWCKLSPAVESS
jgi:hypothetical protein